MYHQVSPEPQIEQLLTLLTSNIPSYNLSGLNVKIPDKPFNTQTLDKEYGPINSALEQTETHLLESQGMDFYRNQEKPLWEQREFVIYMKATNNWQRMELFGSLLRFKLLCLPYLFFFFFFLKNFYSQYVYLHDIIIQYYQATAIFYKI